MIQSKRIFRICISVSIFGLAWVAGAAEISTPAAHVSPSPSLAPVPVIAPSPIPIAKNEAKALLQAFVRAQKTELTALEHRHRMELRELKASQNARRKEWESKERTARHEFFKANKEGPARRAYVQEFLQRRKALQSMFKEERVRRKQEQVVRRKAIEDEQSMKRKEFQAELAQGIRPADTLWPPAGR